MLAYGKLLDDDLRMILANSFIGFARPLVSDQHRFLPEASTSSLIACRPPLAFGHGRTRLWAIAREKGWEP
jgi:hypothetical protein